jgi:E3 ubiquitin-protein ligase NEDD4
MSHCAQLSDNFFYFCYRDDLTDAESGSIHLQAQHAFTTRRQISEEAESVDNRESSEV